MTIPSDQSHSISHLPKKPVDHLRVGAKETASKNITSFKTSNVNWTHAAKEAAAKVDLEIDIKDLNSIDKHDFPKYLKLEVGDAPVVWINREDALKLAEKILPKYTSQESNKLELLCKKIDTLAKGAAPGKIVKEPTAADVQHSVSKAKEKPPTPQKAVNKEAESSGTNAPVSAAAPSVSKTPARSPDKLFKFETLRNEWTQIAKALGKLHGVEMTSQDEEISKAFLKTGLTTLKTPKLSEDYFTVKIIDAAPIWFKRSTALELYQKIFKEEQNQKLSDDEKINEICIYISHMNVHSAVKEMENKQLVDKSQVPSTVKSAKELEKEGIMLTTDFQTIQRNHLEISKKICEDATYPRNVIEIVQKYNSEASSILSHSLKLLGSIENLRLSLSNLKKTLNSSQKDQLELFLLTIEIEMELLEKIISSKVERNIFDDSKFYKEERSFEQKCLRATGLKIALAQYQELSSLIEKVSLPAFKERSKKLVLRKKQFEVDIKQIIAQAITFKLPLTQNEMKNKLLQAESSTVATILKSKDFNPIAAELRTILSFLTMQAFMNDDKNALGEAKTIIQKLIQDPTGEGLLFWEHINVKGLLRLTKILNLNMQELR